MLYELLAGSPPFSRKDLEKKGLLKMLRVVREEEPPKPSTKLSTADAVASLSANRSTEPKTLTALLRSELDWIVLKALEKDRTRRYETATAFAADVQRYLAGEAVLAHPPSRGYRMKKFLRKNRGPAVAAGVVALALLVGMVGTGSGLIRAKEKERVALGAVEEERRAKLREAAQTAIAVDQRTKAESARDRTRTVLDAMVSDVTGDSLAAQKAITVEQKTFLAEVLIYYKEFVSAQQTTSLPANGRLGPTTQSESSNSDWVVFRNPPRHSAWRATSMRGSPLIFPGSPHTGCARA